MISEEKDSSFPFKGAIFDLDGTLLDTLEDIADAANAVLARQGLQVHPTESYKTFVGDGVKVLMERIIPSTAVADNPHIHQTCLADMKKEYLTYLNRKAKPYTPIPQLIKFLRDRHVKLAVLSNKPHHLTLECIKEFFDTDTFNPVLGLRDGAPAKPDPSGVNEIASSWNLPTSEILYFGDTDTDMKTAVNSGTFPVGVLWGFRSKNELHHAGAQWLINSMSDFISLTNSPAPTQPAT